jgi:hypothetical protein
MQAAEPEPKRTNAAITADETTHQKLADPYRNKIERQEPHPPNHQLRSRPPVYSYFIDVYLLNNVIM